MDLAKESKQASAAVRMTTAEAVVETLIVHGVTTVYALPGVHNDHLFDALFKAADRIRTIHTRHEQGAAYMALGAALATGKPQTYAVVPGPGLLNSSAALLTAYGMNAPVLALVGQIPQAAIGRGSGICTRSATRPASSPAWSISPRAFVNPPRRQCWSPKPSAQWQAGVPALPCWNARWMCGVAARQ